MPWWKGGSDFRRFVSFILARRQDCLLSWWQADCSCGDKWKDLDSSPSWWPRSPLSPFWGLQPRWIRSFETRSVISREADDLLHTSTGLGSDSSWWSWVSDATGSSSSTTISSLEVILSGEPWCRGWRRAGRVWAEPRCLTPKRLVQGWGRPCPGTGLRLPHLRESLCNPEPPSPKHKAAGHSLRDAGLPWTRCTKAVAPSSSGTASLQTPVFFMNHSCFVTFSAIRKSSCVHLWGCLRHLLCGLWGRRTGSVTLSAHVAHSPSFRWHLKRGHYASYA